MANTLTKVLGGSFGPKIFGIIFLAFIALIILSRSLINVAPGQEGHVYHPFGGGLNVDKHYSEGMHLVAPWNEMIIYDIRQKTKDQKLEVLDKNGLDVEIDLSLTYSPTKGQTGIIHNETGENYEEVLIIPQMRSVTREIIGRYTAEELYSTKRDVLQTEIEDMLNDNLNSSHITVKYALVRDVGLPERIATAIQDKEQQEQKNLLAQKMKVEAINLAAAEIERARGDSSAQVIRAAAEAEMIRLKQAQLAKSPNYIELVKAQQWDGSYGQGNVYGEGISLFKSLPGK